MKGYIHVYTGNGKGKTTAAVGLSIRALGAGKKVFFAQFVKGMLYSEIEALKHVESGFCIKQYGRACFIVDKPTPKDVEAARLGLEEVAEIISSGIYDVVVLDEACIALHYNLFTVEELIRMIESRPLHTEIVVTGRYAPEELIAQADLVTEMKEIKHYYNEGIEARKGIEY